MSMPTSLEIAQAASCARSPRSRAEIGILPEELEPYGPYKAKVRLELPGSTGRPTRRAGDRGHRAHADTARRGQDDDHHRPRPGAQPDRRAHRGRDPSAVARAPCSASRAAAPEAATARSCRWRTSTFTSPGTSTRSRPRTTWAPPSSTTTCFAATHLDIDPTTIRWPRVVDVNDRVLRRVHRHGRDQGRVRASPSGTSRAASEVMAILALANDLADLRARIGRVDRRRDLPRRAGDARGPQGGRSDDGGDARRDQAQPAQTLEGGPAFVHAGPFANIAHGNSSVVADRVALRLVDAVVTEGGFGADMGFQKFVDIKCRLSGLRPSAAVIVATIRALKMHGGVGTIVAGKPLDAALEAEESGGRPARGREPRPAHRDRGHATACRQWSPSTRSRDDRVPSWTSCARLRWPPAPGTPWRAITRRAAPGPRTWREPSGQWRGEGAPGLPVPERG